MRYLSLCSGIEAASQAFLPLGWEAVAFAEIEKFPCAVLKHHYPDVPNLGDVSLITEQKIKQLGHVDVCIFGFPCTDLSVAGQRKGLKHEDGTNTRSGLFFDCHKVARWSGARFILVENVPGLFSSHEGRDFATVVGELAGAEISVPEDGWRNSGFALGSQGLVEWRVLDAQYDGLAQRRERVFLILDTGDWANRPPILLEPTSMSGNPSTRREAGQEVAGTFGARTSAGGGFGGDFETSGGLTTGYQVSGHAGYSQGTGPLRANGGDNGGGSENLAVIPINMQAAAKTGVKSPNMLGIGDSGDPAYTVNASDQHAVAIGFDSKQGGDTQLGATDELSPPLKGVARHAVAHTLRAEHDASEDGTGRGTPLVPEVAWALQERDSKGSDSSTKDGHLIPVLTICKESNTLSHADATEADTVETLRILRDEIGEEAFAEWGLGVLVSFLPEEILQSAVHGKGIRCPTVSEFGLVNYALSRKETGAERFVREMRETQRERRSSFGWGSHEQRSVKLAAYLSELSQPGASATQILRDLRKASEGVGILRSALSEVQEVGRPNDDKGKPVCSTQERRGADTATAAMQSSWVWETISRAWSLWKARNSAAQRKTEMAVRRLTVIECEFLMGLPRNYTLIPYRGKMSKDGPRYRSIGNSMAVPVVAWIGKRIQDVAKIN